MGLTASTPDLLGEQDSMQTEGFNLRMLSGTALTKITRP